MATKKSRVDGLMLVKSDSKRLPNKNTLPFHGKPMFIVNLKKCLKIFDKVYVSSDSLEILEQALKAGAIPIKRPKKLCGDVPNIQVYRHAMKEMDCDAFVAVQANSPTVRPVIIEAAEEMIQGCAEVITCHPDKSVYGSVWAMTKERLKEYIYPYRPKSKVCIEDESIDIHDIKDYNKALNE